MPDHNGLSRLREDMAALAAERPSPDLPPGVIGVTMFDQIGSEDGTVTVLLARPNVHLAPAQSLVRVVSRGDGRTYLGVVSAGPFALPDSLRPDSPVLVTVATNGADYLPPFHGRVQVSLIGEEKDGVVVPARLRPLPHSQVYRLTEAESAQVLRADGDLRLGLAAGHGNLPVCLPTGAKSVLPRHTAVLGTTGAGKSTTVAGLIARARAAGMAVVVLDVEGEYTTLNAPADNGPLLARLRELGLKPEGVPADAMAVYHLTGRETTNPAHPNRREFSLQFAMLSPYAVMELLGLNDAQTDRFLFAYEVAKALLRELGIFPRKNVSDVEQAKEERLLRNIDEFERGYPRLTLSLFLDVVKACKAKATKGGTFEPFNDTLKTDTGQAALKKILHDKDMPGNPASWGKLHSLLWRLNKLRVFHGPGVRAAPIRYADLLKPGQLTVIDLSDAGLSELSNLAVADVLRGVQEEQERAYRRFEKKEAPNPPRVLVVIEEAHEFLSEERVDKMPVLFQQLSRLARRGRKRWLGLAFVTQLPQHLPRSVLGLCNSFVLHKLTDSAVVAGLRKSIGGIDDGLWNRLPALAPGQAVVAMPHLTRPLLVDIDPAAGKLRMQE